MSIGFAYVWFYKGVLYFSFNLLQIHGRNGKQNTIKPSQVEEGRNFNASHL